MKNRHERHEYGLIESNARGQLITIYSIANPKIRSSHALRKIKPSMASSGFRGTSVLHETNRDYKLIRIVTDWGMGIHDPKHKSVGILIKSSRARGWEKIYNEGKVYPIVGYRVLKSKKPSWYCSLPVEPTKEDLEVAELVILSQQKSEADE